MKFVWLKYYLQSSGLFLNESEAEKLGVNEHARFQ